MRTAIVSDLHLGLRSGGDVARDPTVRSLLLAELAEADRVVLLGDIVELRDQPLGSALARSRPFFEELGAVLGEREVLMVPGNHDHRFAEPLLDALSPRDGTTTPLGLEQLADPSPGPTAEIDSWLGRASLRIAYPGVWLREDVYATHGHYMDAHLRLPRAECLLAATIMRVSRAIPEADATPADYERVLRPIYGLAFATAQAREPGAGRSRGETSEAAWEVLAGARPRRAGTKQRLKGAAFRRGFPLGLAAVNRLLGSSFEADVSGAAIFGGSIEAIAETVARLGVDGVQVIFGHSHRSGPTAAEVEWRLAGGGRLHNTGSWVFASIFHQPGDPPNSYWPGTVTWLEDEGPPRRVQLLLDRSHSDLTELIKRTRATGR